MNTFARRIAPLAATALVAPLLVGGIPGASAQQGDESTEVVTNLDLGDWRIETAPNSAPAGGVTFDDGPSGDRDPSTPGEDEFGDGGSLKLETDDASEEDEGEDVAVFTGKHHIARGLDAILGELGLAYSTWVENRRANTSVAPVVRLHVDYVTPDLLGDGTAAGESAGSGILIFEPAYTGSVEDVEEQEWQRWDATAPDSVWWSHTPVPGTEEQACTTAYVADLDTLRCTWDDIRDAQHSATVTRIEIAAGDEVNAAGQSNWNDFVGHVDALTINSTTYDFEHEEPPVEDPAYAFALGAPPTGDGDADGTNMLWRFDLRNPLQTGAGPFPIRLDDDDDDEDEGDDEEVVVGIDFDPASEQLYALTRTPVTDGSTAAEPVTGLGRVVVIDPETAEASPLPLPEVDVPEVAVPSVPDVTTGASEIGEVETPVATSEALPIPAPFPLRGTEFGISFGSLEAAEGDVDVTATTGSLLYAVSDAGEKLVIDPTTGALLAQTQMTYEPDPDADPPAEVPALVGLAEVGDGLWAIDSATDQIVDVTDPVVAQPLDDVSLGFDDTDHRAALDVAPDGTRYAAVTGPSSTTQSRLSRFDADESEGAFEPVSAIGGGLTVLDIALPPTGMLAFGSADVSVDEEDDDGEGVTVDVTVERTGGSFGDLTAKVATEDGSATGGESCEADVDYVALDEPVTFAEHDTDSVTIQICPDDRDEGTSESFTLTLVEPNGPHILGQPASATVTIDDEGDESAGTIEFDPSEYSVVESTDDEVVVTVVRTGGSEDVAVTIETEDGSAIAGADGEGDYDTVEVNETFTADDNEIDVPIPINDDSEVEGDEQFTVELSLPAESEATLGPNSTATVTIVDDPAGTISFAGTEAEVAEGGETELSLQRENGSEGAVTLDVTSTGTGDAPAGGDDYDLDDTAEGLQDHTTVEFDAGVEGATLTVAAEPDGDIEGAETFALDLSIVDADGAPILGDASTATVTILDRTLGTALVLMSGNRLVGFNLDNPETVTDPIEITGTDDRTVVGIDYAAADPESEVDDTLYAVARDAQGFLRLYTLELPADTDGSMQAEASLVDCVTLPEPLDALNETVGCVEIAEAVSLAPTVLGEQIGVDVNPENGDVHVTSDGGDHVVFDPDSGLGTVNVPLTYDATVPDPPDTSELPDPNDPPDDPTELLPEVPEPGDASDILAEVVSIAHDDPPSGAPALFGLDAGRNALVTQQASTTPLGDGRLGEVGDLIDPEDNDVDLPNPAGFDVLGGDLGFAAFATGGDLTIHSVGLTADDDGNVVVTPRGIVGDGTTSALDLAIRPAGILAFDGDVETNEADADDTNLTVSRTGGTGYEVAVDYEIVDDTEDDTEDGTTCGEDYAVLVENEEGSEETCELTGTLTFDAGVSEDDIAIRVFDDDEWEGNESFTVTLSEPTTGARLGGTSSATFTIKETEAEIGTIGFAVEGDDVEEGVEGGTLDVSLERTGDSEGDVVVRVTTSDDSAVAGEDGDGDYDAVDTTVTFTAGSTVPDVKTVTVAINDDALLEGEETFDLAVELVDDSPPADIGESDMTVTILDEEPGVVYGVTGGEADHRLVTFAPGRPSEAGDVGTLTGLADGDEVVAVDFNPLDGKLYAVALTDDKRGRVYEIPVPDGESDNSTEIEVAEVGTVPEVFLDGTRFGADFDPTQGTLRVVSEATQNLRLTIGDGSVSAVQLDDLHFAESEDFPSVAAIAYAATGGDDAPLFGIDAERNALFEHQDGDEGEGCRCELHEVGDLVDEDDESVDATELAGFDTDGRGRGLAVFDSGSATVYAVDLADPDGSADEIGVVTIDGDDGETPDTPDLVGVTYAPAGLLSFAGTPTEVDERDEEITLTVERSGGTKLDVSAGVAVSGDLDGLEIVPDTVNFLEGEAGPKTVTVTWDDDSVDEPDPTLTVSLVKPEGGAAIGNPGEVTIDVADDDDPPEVSVENATAPEGDSGTKTVSVPVSLSNVSGKTIEVEYETVEGTAEAGSEYETTSGALTIEPGVEDAQIEVEILGDTLDEPDEAFTVRIVDAENAGVAAAAATVTVVDDDPQPTLSATGRSAPEGDSGTRTVSIPVKLSDPSGRTVSVDFATANGSADAGADYVRTSGTLRFPPGRTASTIRVAVKGDTVDEPNESFTVRLSSPSHASLSTRSVTVTIGDDDEPPPQVEGVTVEQAPANSQSTPDGRGYWIATDEGDVFGFGNAERFGSLRGAVATADIGAPVVELTATAEGDGYWLLDDQGGVFTFGDAPFFGSLPGRVQQGIAGPAEVTDMARTPSGEGYVILDQVGGVHTFGDAEYHGSIPGLRADGQSIGRTRFVSIAVTPDGGGYWMLDENGGVFTFGNAEYFDSIPGLRAAGVPIGQTTFVSLAPTSDGRGYWIVDRDGGVFTFGNAEFHGSIPGLKRDGHNIGNAATAAIEPAPGGDGYWIFDQVGGVFTFGSARFAGSVPGLGRS